jgi:hypothetical protein
VTPGVFRESSSENPSNTACTVNRFGIVDRLRLLAPLHRVAALRRAAEAAGLLKNFKVASLDDLAIAEAPPVILWRTEIQGQYTRPPTPADVAHGADALMRDINWRMAQPMQPARDLRAAARRETQDRLAAERAQATAPHLVSVPVPESVAAHQRGLALAQQHGVLLIALADLLDGLDDVIPQSRLAATEEDAIRDLAAKRAEECVMRSQMRADVCRATGKPLPEETPDDRRRADPLWHRRQIRREAAQARQHLAAALRTVGRGAAPYADDYSVSRWRERQASAIAWAEKRVWQTEDGKTVPMTTIISGKAETALFRLSSISSGVDEIAQGAGLVPLWITMTLPPRFHPNPKRGRRSWTTDLSPRLTDARCKQLWGRFRSRLRKSGVRRLGTRVWEAHEDGCPHIHALMYVAPDDADTVDRHLLALCPEPETPPRDTDGNAKRVASKLEPIDRERGSPTTYIRKYLTKTVTLPAAPGDAPARGHTESEAAEATTADEATDYGEDRQIEAYERHQATASERRWRRYAALGTHGIQRIWQRLIRAKDDELIGAPPRVIAADAALRAHRWADALTAMGAIREDGAHRLMLEYETTLNAYGEETRRPAWIVDTEDVEKADAENRDPWRLPLRSRGELVRLPRQENSAAEKARQEAHDAEQARDYERIAADIASVSTKSALANTQKYNENKAVSVGVTCPRAGADAPAEADPALAYDGRGTFYDPETGEIVDEIPVWRPPEPPSDYIPDPDRDDFEMELAA